jgi:hypothetical protein
MLSIQAQKGRHKGGREEKPIDYDLPKTSFNC